MGALEIEIIPPSGSFNSSIRKIAPESDSAPMNSTTTTSLLRGANRPKLTKVTVSQNTSTTRNGTGMDEETVERLFDRYYRESSKYAYAQRAGADPRQLEKLRRQ